MASSNRQSRQFMRQQPLVERGPCDYCLDAPAVCYFRTFSSMASDTANDPEHNSAGTPMVIRLCEDCEPKVGHPTKPMKAKR